MRIIFQNKNLFAVYQNVFSWEQYPIGAASRSGHSLIARGSSLYVIGGRADHLIQHYTGLPTENQNICQHLYSDLKDMIQSKVVIQ